MKKKKTIKKRTTKARSQTRSAKTFEERFDDGEDITEFLDLSTAKRINTEVKRVNVDFPIWVINNLDLEAKRIGISRQSLLKMWIAQRLDEISLSKDEEIV